MLRFQISTTRILGATVEIAALLSKRALSRRIGSRNPNPFAARLKEELRRDLNELGIGSQGLGGGSQLWASLWGTHTDT